MRPFLCAILCFCIVNFSCKKETQEDISVEVRTYSHQELTYPSQTIQIPDSLQNEFTKNFFVPWNLNPEDLTSTLDSFPGKNLSYLENYLNDDEWYGENKKPHKKWQREEIVYNINTESFPNFLQNGIVTTHTNLRRVPTNRPGFDKYSKAGEGYPFDYFQETALWANTPLFILHTSNDKQWCYAISPYYKGWVPMRDVALVDQDFIEQWSAKAYCLPLSDQVILKNNESNYAVNAKVGMVLPYEEESESQDMISVYYANSDENQNARILKAEVPKNAVAQPNFKFNGESMELLVSNLIGKPYGWGGNLENRDCSSMIRDMLGTYKLWLPRDSKDQINSGHQYDLPSTTEEKIKFIKDKGIPFLTILRKKGHNMLYVGVAPNGDPLIFHAIWGLKTLYSNEELAKLIKTYPIEGIHQDDDGQLHGRHIIGEAVVTSVNIGANNDHTTPLIEDIYAMTNIIEP